MARVWKHFDRTGGYVEWAAGTEPNPRSFFMPKFLNQFVMWFRFLKACGGIEEGAKTPIWVRDRRTIIQYASFWNNLIFKPGPRWVAYNPAEGADSAPYSGNPGYADKLTTRPPFTGELPKVEVGETIHPGAPYEVLTEFLMAARARLDACKAWVLDESWSPPTGSAAADISSPFSGVTADMKNHQWTLYDSTPSKWDDQGVSDSAYCIDYFIKREATYWQHGQSYATNVSIAPPSDTDDLGATVYLGIHCRDGVDGTPLPNIADDDHATFIHSEIIGTSPVSIGGTIGQVGTPPGLSPAAIFAKQNLFPVYVAPDTPPSGFQPPDGLP